MSTKAEIVEQHAQHAIEHLMRDESDQRIERAIHHIIGAIRTLNVPSSSEA